MNILNIIQKGYNFDDLANDQFSEKTINSLKVSYTDALQRMYSVAGKLPDPKDPDYLRCNLIWQMRCCSQVWAFWRLFRYLKQRGIIQYTSADIETAWGKVNWQPKKVVA